ncbi:MAG TPA: hypothetical protein VKO18_08900 [Terriglobia bacterium]|nr:hypothetical protein [Terriglobia bacterium]
MATETASAQNTPKQFEQAGFVVTEAQPGRIELRKSACVAYLENLHGHWRYSGPPYFVVHGINCELEDRGYQKFWYSKTDGKRFPIRKVELEALHRFDEEVRYLLGMRDLYNEALGTTNARTVYDRLTGRPDR